MSDTYIITGVAGFIGSNLAERLLRDGHRVVGVDNLSRAGSERNLDWLQRVDCGEFSIYKTDIQFRPNLSMIFNHEAHAKAVFHLAAQTAVTTSLTNPRGDFETNALGTLNVLEAMRVNKMQGVMVYASTNKVYGALDNPFQIDRLTVETGFDERTPINPQTPYGCSKACGDQYVLDYARTYRLNTVSLRQSCIYGPYQYGCVDQGWMAWFTIAALTGKGITVYGDGQQVRDVLHVDDLVDLYLRVAEAGWEGKGEKVRGQVFNVGGGPGNVLTVQGLLDRLYAYQKKQGPGPRVTWTYEPARPGDQRVYVSDIGKAQRELGWVPKVGVEEGVGKLVEWVEGNLDLF